MCWERDFDDNYDLCIMQTCMQAYLRAEVWQVSPWFPEHGQELFLQTLVTPQSTETLCHFIDNFWHTYIEHNTKKYAETFVASESHGLWFQFHHIKILHMLAYPFKLN